MKCERCGGDGEIDIKVNGYYGREGCPDCNGTGEKPSEPTIGEIYQKCKTCSTKRVDGGMTCDLFCGEIVEGNESMYTPKPTESSQDERIREAFEKVQTAVDGYNFDKELGTYYLIDDILADYEDDFAIILTNELRIFKAGFKYRDEEVDRLQKKIKELLSKAEWGW